MGKCSRYRCVWLLLLLAVTAVFVFPPTRWRIVGFVRGESFYRGLPTHYWSGRIKTWKVNNDRYGQLDILPSQSSGNSVLAWLHKLVGPSDREALVPPLSLDDGKMQIGGAFFSDPAALAVMVELLGDPDRDVRLHALQRLIVLDAKDGRAACSALVKMLSTSDPQVRRCAAQGLYHFGAEGPEAIAGLIEALDADDDWTCTYAALALGNLGARANAAVPSLERLLQRKRGAGPPISRYVPDALKQIDPGVAVP